MAARERWAAAFLAEGLEAGGTCFLAAEAGGRERVLARLARDWPAARAAARSGRPVLSHYAPSAAAQLEYWEAGPTGPPRARAPELRLAAGPLRLRPCVRQPVTNALNEPLRVLVLEDCAVAGESVQQALDAAGLHVVAERVDSQEAFVHALEHFVPDVVLSGCCLTHLDATAALDAWRALRPTVPFILVTDELDEGALLQCLRAGAADVVVKRRPSRLLSAVETALAVRRPLRTLSRRQVQGLRFISQGHSPRGIARQLALSPKTVETHRAKLMSRLGLHHVAGLVRYAVRVGLSDPEP